MKHLIIVFFFFTLLHTARAQDTFELIIEDPLDQMITCVIETDEYYYISTIFGMYSSERNKTKLFKIEKEGEIVLSEVLETESYEFMIYNIIFNENGQLTGFGHQKPAVDSVAYFTIIEINNNFSITAEVKYETCFSFISSYLNIKKIGDYYTMVGSGQNTHNTLRRLFAYKTNALYDTIISKVYPEEGITYAFDMISTFDNMYLKVFTRGFEQQTSTNGQIILLDSMLNRVEYTGVPEFVFSFNDAMYIDEAHYLLTGQKDISNEVRQGTKLAIMLMDTADVMQDIRLLGPADTTNYPGFYSNLDFVDPENIYYGGTKNLSFGYFIAEDSWFFLNKLNSNFEIQWQKFYGGDANYNLWNLIATQDGGCLMAGTRYDYITQTNLRDVYIIKVNEDGLITGLGDEHSHITVHDAIVYPNPGSNYLKVQSGPQINRALFELFDLTGKIAASEVLNCRLCEINTSYLPAGTYTYRITFMKQLVGSGKWIKN